MTTTLLFTRDAGGFNTFGVRSSDTKYSTTLASGVSQALVVPTDESKYLAVFASNTGGNYYVAINKPATVAGASFATTNSDLNPPALRVDPGDTLNFITDDTLVHLNVKFYAGVI